MHTVRIFLLLFVIIYLVPLAVTAGRYWWDGSGAGWQVADRSSAGLLPKAEAHPGAAVRIFAARTVRWRGIVASHCWIVFKGAGEARYTRYDYTAWGEPIRVNGFEADGRWFGALPEVVFAADGEAAAGLIPGIERAIAAYAWRNVGDYRAWPGPNSNTFIAAIIDGVPGMVAALPATAVGKAYPYDGRWVRRTPSHTGLTVTLGGYVAVTVGWVEGLEVSIGGAVAGLDVRRPAITLPGLGRVGLRAAQAEQVGRVPV